jgi:uncharacterized protein (DUF2147 family)
MAQQSRLLTAKVGATDRARERTRLAMALRFRLVIFAALLLASVPARAADSPTGLWLTRDHDGIIKIFPCDGGLCAEIAGVILDHPTDPTPVDYRGVSQCHLQLITDAKPVQPNLWKGHIINPRNGTIYGVEFHVDPHHNLALRGFVGLPLFGETQIWTRYNGRVPDDCRLSANSGAKSRTVPSAPGRAQ